MNKSLARPGLVLAAGLLALFAAPAALAYNGTVPHQVVITLPAIECPETATVTATVTDETGAPVDDARVEWSFVSGRQAGDSLAPTTSFTDADGEATTQLTLGPDPGDRVIRATVGDASATATATCDDVGGLGPTPPTTGNGGTAPTTGPTPPTTGGLPRTSTSPGESAVPLWPLALVTIAVAGSALLVSRKARG